MPALRHMLVLLCLAATFAGRAPGADIEVKLLRFGTGEVLRGGGAAALQLELRSSLDRVAEVELALELPNADLDVVEHARSVVLNPGQAQRRWIYGDLPPLDQGALGGLVVDLRLYELEGGERVRDLGTVRLSPGIADNPPKVLGLGDDAILVVGPRAAGLDIYGQVGSAGEIPSMNLATVLGNLRDADSFPDRWEGYEAFDAVVWANGSIAPSRLSEEAARALRQWVERGGDLVIALPAAGDPWSVGVPDRHGFSSILPSKAPERIDDVPVADLLPLLSLDRSLRDPRARTRLSVFDPASLDRGWRPFLSMPARRVGVGLAPIPADSIDGRVVAVRRAYGFGHVTLVGIDIEEISARGLQTPALPQGDAFWNRLLGRRADTPSGAEYQALSDAGRLTAARGYATEIGEGEAIAPQIGLSGEAALGVLAAVAVFGLYWLLAGPLGFAVLKATKRERWSWVGFVVVAAVFSAAILAVARPLASSQARIRHLVVLDAVERPKSDLASVAEPEWRRVSGWFSIYAPVYGQVEVALDPEGPKELRNRLRSWRGVGVSAQGYPGVERSRAPIDAAGTLTVPARATSIDFEADWLGAVDLSWGRLPHETSPVAVRIDGTRSPATVSVAGSLSHGLPGPLRNVLLVHVWPVRNPAQSLVRETGKPPVRRFPGQLPNRGQMTTIASWAPGETLDLASALPVQPVANRAGLEQAMRERYYANLYREASQFAGFVESRVDPRRSLEMLSFHGMLEPPAYLQNPPSDPEVFRVRRVDGRDLDLSSWWTEPCLIVLGTLDAASLPFPVALDGEEVASEGQVLVRWILPLPADAQWTVPDKPVVADDGEGGDERGDADGNGGDGREEAPDAG
jgi:SAM-dependent methyltransferase